MENLADFLSKSKDEKFTQIIYDYIEEPNLGIRKQMEDFTIRCPNLTGDDCYAFFCILDGHGGQEVAQYLKENYPELLRQKLIQYKYLYPLQSIVKMTIENIENQLRMIDSRDRGSTLCGVLIDCKNQKGIMFNIGDSRCYQIKYNQQLIVQQLSEIHNIENEFERQRIKMSGNKNTDDRMGGDMLVTRSLGDFDQKKYGIISNPQFENIDDLQDSIIVLASDGIWDVIDKQQLQDIFIENCKDLRSLNKAVVSKAINNESEDNISIISLIVSNQF